MSDVSERVCKIVADRLQTDLASVTPTASFVEDLGADSLDLVELVMAFEEEFSLEIPDADVENLKTVGAVAEYLEKRVTA